jgi:hypothetical protein
MRQVTHKVRESWNRGIATVSGDLLDGPSALTKTTINHKFKMKVIDFSNEALLNGVLGGGGRNGKKKTQPQKFV